MEITQKRYVAEKNNWDHYLSDDANKKRAESWFRTDTVDAWRHGRMYACIDPLLGSFPDATWLTVGDGRFGKDAHYIREHGGEVTATDISDALLREAKAKRYIDACKAENAEALSFEDQSFDFVFCKEAYHHFPRPMVALYEMLRVARKGVVIIEPCESPLVDSRRFVMKRIFKQWLIDHGMSQYLRNQDTSLLQPYRDKWESVGNYQYRVSKREMEKVAWGLSLPAVAFRQLNDCYIEGVEDEEATDDSQLFAKLRSMIERGDKLAASGLNQSDYNILCTVYFKDDSLKQCEKLLRSAGYKVKLLPHMDG